MIFHAPILREIGRAPLSMHGLVRRALAGLAKRTAPPPERVVVLALGNEKWGDADAGAQSLARLKARWVLPAQVELVDGETLGRALVPLLESASRLIVLSALDLQGPPGTLHVLTGDAAAEQLYVRGPKRPGMGFAAALACAQLAGRVPRELVLIGLQPQRGDRYGAQLSPAVAAQLDRAADVACDWLRRWRVETLARETEPPARPS